MYRSVAALALHGVRNTVPARPSLVVVVSAACACDLPAVAVTSPPAGRERSFSGALKDGRTDGFRSGAKRCGRIGGVSHPNPIDAYRTLSIVYGVRVPNSKPNSQIRTYRSRRGI